MDRFPLGDTAVIGDDTGFTFSVDGALTDPTAVTIIITSPSAITSTYSWPSPATITRISTGTFRLAVTVNEVGVWSYVITGTGAAEGVQSGSFDVFATDPVNTNYCTLDELKNEKALATGQDDTTLQLSINAASRQIDNLCGWRFWLDPTPVAQTYYPCQARWLDLMATSGMSDGGADGIATTSGLQVKVDVDQDGVFEVPLTRNVDYILAPTNAQARLPLWPFTELQIINPLGTIWFPKSLYGQPTIQITAQYGWPAVPDDVKKAALIQAQMLAKSKDAPFGQVEIGGLGSPLGIRGAVHPFARALLSPYMKPAVG
jgi:hypothetical protein